MKLILTCWLVIPYFSGAAYVYEHFVRPVFVNPRSINIWYVPKKMDIFRKPDDVLTAAEKYIAENGPDAFEKILSRVCHVFCSIRSLNFSLTKKCDSSLLLFSCILQADKSKRYNKHEYESYETMYGEGYQYSEKFEKAFNFRMCEATSCLCCLFMLPFCGSLSCKKVAN